MNYLDKALNGVLDNLERNVVDQVREAAAALEEYPTKVENSDMISPAGNISLALRNGRRWP